MNVLTEKRVIVSNKSCEEFPQFSLQISLKLCCDVETVLRCKSRISTYWIFKIMSLKYTKMSSKQKNISWQAWNSKSTPKTRIVLFARESCKDVAKEKLSRLFFSHNSSWLFTQLYLQNYAMSWTKLIFLFSNLCIYTQSQG